MQHNACELNNTYYYKRIVTIYKFSVKKEDSVKKLPWYTLGKIKKLSMPILNY